MNAKLKLHQIKLQQWAARFQEQADSGLTVKAWCDENNFSIHTYNYWKHQLKQEYVDSVLPDIVPITPLMSGTLTGLPVTENTPSCLSRDLRESSDSNSICISSGDIRIAIGASVSDECIFRILKAVRHA